MKREQEARVVAVAGDDDEAPPPPLSRATAATARTTPTTPSDNLRSSSSPSSSSRIPESLRIPRERIDELLGSGGAFGGALSPTRETVSAVAADSRLVSLLDDADLMRSVSAVAGDPSRFKDELASLSRRGKGEDFVELYRRMSEVVSKRKGGGGGGGEGSEGDERTRRRRQATRETRDGSDALLLGAAPSGVRRGFLLGGGDKEERQEPRAGIQVLR